MYQKIRSIILAFLIPGVQTRAAKILGITERHLRYKLNKYGMK